MSAFDGWLVIGALAVIALPAVAVNLRHRHEPRHALPPLVVGEGDPRFGSMCLTGEAVLHHELPVTPRPDWPEWDDETLAMLRAETIEDWLDECEGSRPVPELGPRAGAVLARYEGRLGARKWAAG